MTCVVVVFAVGTLVRLWGMSRMHAWDENVYLLNAELICCGKHTYNEIDSRPPLLSWIFAAAFLLWHSDYFAWMITALLNALGPVFLYLSGRIFVGRLAAAIAAILLAFTPFLVSVFPPESTGFLSDGTGHSLLADCPALTLIALSFWLLLRALQKETNLRFFMTGLAFASAILMRFGSLSSVAILSLLLLTADRRFRAVAACFTGLLVSVTPYLIWSRIRYGGFFTTFIYGWQNFGGNKESALYYLKYSPYIFTWTAIAGCLLWLASSALQISRPTATHSTQPPGTNTLLNYQTYRECFLFAWAGALMLFFSTLPHQEPRYVIPAELPVLLLAGAGWAKFLQVRSQALRTSSAVVLAGMLLFSFLPIRHRFDTPFLDSEVSEEMKVSDFLNHHIASGSVLYTNSSYPDFGYYTNFHVAVLPMNGAPLYKALDQLDPRSVLIAYKQYDSGPPPEPSLAWLDTNPHFRRLQEFPTMVVYQHIP